uniref:Uncharacterized protein n=1 Tax=Anguilla anguilla TaxID=7936 RepID=A0A0E9SEI2_ANGAN
MSKKRRTVTIVC